MENSKERLNIFGRIVYSSVVQGLIVVCIVLNAIQLGLDTALWWKSFASGFSAVLDRVFIWIFAVEILLKLLSDKHRFFLSGWNNFDLFIVAIAFVPGQGVFSVLRIFRIFRVLRLLYKIPKLRIITESLLNSIPSIGWICLLLSIWFYMCSVIATNLLARDFPDWFGSIGKSMYSLFQIMTLESWSMGIVRPVMQKFPYAWLLFVPFIIFATYTVMNLFIGIMVSAITASQQSVAADTPEEELPSPNAEVLKEIRELRAEIAELKKTLNSVPKA